MYSLKKQLPIARRSIMNPVMRSTLTIKIVHTLVVSLLALMPVWCYIGAYWLFEPHGIFQNIFLVAVAAASLRNIQVILFILWALAIAWIWGK